MTEELSVMPTPLSAFRECRGSLAAPTLQGEAFQFGDKFIKIESLIYGCVYRKFDSA